MEAVLVGEEVVPQALGLEQVGIDLLVLIDRGYYSVRILLWVRAG